MGTRATNTNAPKVEVKLKTKRGSVDKAKTPKAKTTTSTSRRKEKKAAFVTVGTTKFEQLIRWVSVSVGNGWVIISVSSSPRVIEPDKAELLIFL